MTGEEERYKALKVWMKERNILLRHVAGQFGVSGKRNSSAFVCLQKKTMAKEKRDHLLALGFPVELLPAEGPGSGRPRIARPLWPNPEAAKNPLKRRETA